MTKIKAGDLCWAISISSISNIISRGLIGSGWECADPLSLSKNVYKVKVLNSDLIIALFDKRE